MYNPIRQLEALKKSGIYNGKIPTDPNKAMTVLSRVNKATIKKFSNRRYIIRKCRQCGWEFKTAIQATATEPICKKCKEEKNENH